ncbi:MAG: hypothetical protein HY567_03170 [Candidatus Kerfeldbacteria bacterium]|nr:hypothetical protein [Candidatus Kerfeldbacteria bacterium]
MAEFANVKRKKFRSALAWLGNKPGIVIIEGHKHTLIKYVYNGETYPVPTAHKEINKHILKSLAAKLVTWGICSEDDFKDQL